MSNRIDVGGGEAPDTHSSHRHLVVGAEGPGTDLVEEIDLSRDISYAADLVCQVCLRLNAVWLAIHKRKEADKSCLVLLCNDCYIAVITDLRNAQKGDYQADCTACGEVDIDIDSIKFERL